MSITRMVAVWNFSKHKLSPLLALLSIADRGDDDGFAYPGIQDIASRARINERHATRVIKILEETRELYIARRAGKHKNHLYLVTVGQSLDQVIQALWNRFKVPEEEVRQWFVTMPGQPDNLSGDNLSALSWESGSTRPGSQVQHGLGVRLILTPESGESLINPQPNTNHQEPLIQISDFPNQFSVNPFLLYEAAKTQLQLEMQKATYDSKVKDTCVYNYQNTNDKAVLTIIAANPGQREWLEQRLTTTLNKLLTGFADKQVEVIFI